MGLKFTFSAIPQTPLKVSMLSLSVRMAGMFTLGLVDSVIRSIPMNTVITQIRVENF